MKKIFIFLFLLSCIKLDNTIPSISKYNVIANLIVGNDTQYVFFDKTYKPTEEHGKGLEGAKIFVQVKNNIYTFSFPKIIDTMKYYYSVFNPSPNDTFFLIVITPDNETLYSKTISPGNFDIISPIEGETIFIPSNKAIVWTKSDGAFLYKLNIYKFPRDTATGSQIPYLSNDTISDLFKYPYLFKESGFHTLNVMSINHDLYTYINTGKGNILGAEGVFSISVLKRRKVYIVVP
ncbi:MAG: hypothetical protein RMJ38_00845 [candidate division WOR-3 bacterium]|nr:hypothetical protein [candidate division WOR-3 bacterium]MDW8149976.1 hypothetical protein [candidate division WOR-3 bacterium]